MALTTAQAFAQYLEGLTATDYQRTSIIQARKKTVDDRLFEKFPSTSDMPYWKGILMGSAAKGTIIRPFDDIDVLAVFSNSGNAWTKYQLDSKSFIYRIRDATPACRSSRSAPVARQSACSMRPVGTST